MQVRIKSGQNLVEPVTTAEFKSYIGYPGTDQDNFIASLITAARELLEDETALSVISKIYEVEYSRYDMISDDLTKVGYQGWDDGWYLLPFSPVTSITSVKMAGVLTTYSQRGLKSIEIHPDVVIKTGITENRLAVEFTAGEASTRAKNAILRICSDLFNHRESYTGANLGALSYDTQKLISSLSLNTGF